MSERRERMASSSESLPADVEEAGVERLAGLGSRPGVLRALVMFASGMLMGFVGLVGIGLAGRAFADSADTSATSSYRVGAGDVLELSVFAGGELQEHVTGAVAPDGSVACPLVGALRAAGRTVAEITTDLRSRLARDYYQDPRVDVIVREFGATVAVSGEVRHPGVFRLHEARTALGACMLAGGFTDFASARAARVVRVRGGKTETLQVDLAKVKQGRSADVPLEAGDRLDIPRRML
jgi:polysaccharide export outer membrane protein